MKIAYWLWVFPSVLISAPLSALQLDCVDHGDGTYSCVEISQTAEQLKIEQRYIEQAKSECVLRKPRRRMGSMGAGAAIRMEDQKAAQREYDRCVAAKAMELKNAPQ